MHNRMLTTLIQLTLAVSLWHTGGALLPQMNSRHNAFVQGEAFLPRHQQQLRRSTHSVQMDMEEHDPYFQRILKRAQQSLRERRRRRSQEGFRMRKIQRTHDSVFPSHGMPWKTSIDPDYDADSLYYMPFWEWQLDFMKENLTNLRLIPTVSKKGKDMTFRASKEGKMRMHTLTFASDEYKSIRMTVMDAGKRTQVFTSVWYPNPSFNLPLFGVDLMQFNQKKVLCIVDFLPIHEEEQKHDRDYEHLLKPIRDRYPSLQESLSRRFYDPQHFSRQLLLGRPDGSQDGRSPDQVVAQDVMPAYKEYLKAHLQLIRSTQPRPDRKERVLARHAARDTYSASHDPAGPLIRRFFGEDFEKDFVHDVLFPLSQRATD